MADQTGQSESERRNSNVCGWQFSDAIAEWWTGGAKALADGLNAYSNEITPDNVNVFGIGNGIYEGLLAGVASFADGLARTSRRMAEDTREVRNRRAERGARSQTAAIDYEKLAQMVAAEMQKGPKKGT